MATEKERQKRRLGDKDSYDFWEENEDHKESPNANGNESQVSENYERSVVRSSLKASGGPEISDKEERRRTRSEGGVREELEEP